jgi:hypothetical protein
MNPTMRRFNTIRWHDSKLRSLSFYRTETEEEQIRIFLELREKSGQRKPIDLIFHDATYVNLGVYLDGKSMCSDDIAFAACYSQSEWLDGLKDANPLSSLQLFASPEDYFHGYLHFRIKLVEPGGLIDILAKSFSFEPASSNK